MEHDPVSGVTYVATLSQFGVVRLYSIDISNAATAYIGDVYTMPGFSCTMGIAINSVGAAFIVCPNGTGQQLYTLDLQTGATAHVLGLGLPNATIWDICFDEQDRLWLSLDVNASQAALYEGLWRFDFSTLTAYRVLAVTPTFGAIAYVPDIPAPSTYCQAKLNSLGCLPSISGSGWPSSTATSGFALQCTDARNQTAGLFFYGVAGRTAVPFQGGTLCMLGPRQRSPLVSSGGSAPPALDCTGVWQADLNSVLFTRPPIPGGTAMQLQWYGRDTGSPIPVSLSNALEIVLQP
jgi:hypothetical protein